MVAFNQSFLEEFVQPENIIRIQRMQDAANYDFQGLSVQAHFERLKIKEQDRIIQRLGRAAEVNIRWSNWLNRYVEAE